MTVSTCNITGILYDPDNSPIVSTTVRFYRQGQPITPLGTGGAVSRTVSTTTDGSGNLDVDLERGAVFLMRLTSSNGQYYEIAITVPDQASADIFEALPGGAVNALKYYYADVSAFSTAVAAGFDLPEDAAVVVGGVVYIKRAAETGETPAGWIAASKLAETLTNKTLALGSNTVSGTAAQFSAAVTDALAPYSFATRAALVTYWSDGKLPDGTEVSDGTVKYVAQSGATAISDLPGLVPFGPITPLHFQENTDPNVTDMATGFEQMFSYWETLSRRETNNGLYRSSVFGGSVSAEIYIPAGRYYTTYSWKPSSTAGRFMSMRGDGPTKTVIRMPIDGTEDYFIEQQDRDPVSNAYYSVDISGIKFVGGKGLYLNSEPDAPFVQRGVQLVNIDILGFTECAVGSLWADDPRWTFHRVRIETISPNTKGLYLPRGVANPSFLDVTILGCTYRVVFAGEFQSNSVISGLTMFSIVGDDHEADIWCKTTLPSDPNDGRGMIFTGNRFSNENRGGKPIFLIADGDGAGSEITEAHSTSTSTRRFRDWIFTSNTMTGEGSADVAPAGPMVVSYTTDIGSAEVSGNSINNGFSELLWLSADPTGSNANGFKIGPNRFVGDGEAPVFCNRPFGQWIWGDGTETPAASTPLPNDGGIDPSYDLVNINSGGARISMGTAATSSANLVAATDAHGFADARSVVYTLSNGYVEFDADTTQLAAVSLEPGDNFFVEWEAKTAGSFNLEEVDVEILATMPGGAFTKRVSYRPTDGWRRNRIALQLPEVPTGFRVRFMPSPEKHSGSSDRTVIARPYFYRATRPFVSTPVQLPELAKANLTSASAAVAGRMVYVPDETGGPIPAFSDGTNWRRVSDRAVVS